MYTSRHRHALAGGLKILNPLQLYYAAGDRSLKKAVRDVEDLLKRIREHAEAAHDDVTEGAEEAGLLAAMPEVAALTEAQEVPPYVLTVNDRMLDDVRLTLKRLRRLNDAGAERYKALMFSVVQGIQIVTEACLDTEGASGLAVDIRSYLMDDSRYHAWKTLLGHYARKGAHQEAAEAFLRFMTALRQGATSSTPVRDTPTVEEDSVSRAPRPPEIPEILDEATLPMIEKAARQEAKNLLSLIQTDGSPSSVTAWQFELVRRQSHPHLREDAQRMLQIFLKQERAELQKICETKMIPCRTWDQILYLLGAKDGSQLQERVEEGRLTLEEIVVLEKAFLQTFAKLDSLGSIYGHGEGARVMLELHTPQIRSETLVLLRRCYHSEHARLDRTTETLDSEETPQRHEVARLIQHYVIQRHDPPHVDL